MIRLAVSKIISDKLMFTAIDTIVVKPMIKNSIERSSFLARLISLNLLLYGESYSISYTEVVENQGLSIRLEKNRLDKTCPFRSKSFKC
jgi:predicted Zn-dependent peptidase